MNKNDTHIYVRKSTKETLDKHLKSLDPEITQASFVDYAIRQAIMEGNPDEPRPS